MAATLIGLTCLPAEAAIHYVAPNGSPTNFGTPDSPLDLATALSIKSAIVRPGDTVVLDEGTYHGGFRATLSGTVDDPIVIRGAPGRRVTIDAAESERPGIAASGDWTVWRDLEITNSDPRRNSKHRGRWASDLRRRAGIEVTGDHVRLINLVIHDAGQGMWLPASSRDVEAYGCICYYNGWDCPYGGQGHGIEAQNEKEIKRLHDNIVFNNFGCGIYLASRVAQVNGFDVEGNFVFDNGVLAGDRQRQRNLLAGSLSHSGSQLRICDNVLRHAGCAATSVQIGRTMKSKDLVFTGNYVIGSMQVLKFRTLEVSGNLFACVLTMVHLHTEEKTERLEYHWDRNRYHFVEGAWFPMAYYRGEHGGGLDVAEWRRKTGLDRASFIKNDLPHGVEVFVRPNRYEEGRAHVAIVNWDRAPQVEVDLAAVARPGHRYRIVSARDYYGPAVAEGRWEPGQKKVTLAMPGPPPAAPVGDVSSPPPEADSGFACFVVLPVLESQAESPHDAPAPPAPRDPEEPQQTQQADVRPN
ncbi:MAG: right-handed parallel beta-helix repeat-containing protein [Planctomycetes bacterium]|nr:right-handed parallel beta-helix repeat-containing protein [Planctomycetota bacterium]